MRLRPYRTHHALTDRSLTSSLQRQHAALPFLQLTPGVRSIAFPHVVISPWDRRRDDRYCKSALTIATSLLYTVADYEMTAIRQMNLLCLAQLSYQLCLVNDRQEAAEFEVRADCPLAHNTDHRTGFVVGIEDDPGKWMDLHRLG